MSSERLTTSDPEGRLVSFVADAAPPDAARRRAGLSFLDFSLCLIAGARTPAGQKLLRLVCTPALPSAGASEDLTASGRAAFLYAALGHVLDCDDNHDTIGGHPSCILVPALLNAAGDGDQRIADLLTPYVVGLEVMAAMGRVFGRLPYDRGWHTTCVYGVIGAVTALARQRRVDTATTRSALAFACSAACGTKASFGSDAKAVQVGTAALSGVRALALATAGLSAAGNPLSARQGLAAALGCESPAWGELDQLNSRWESLRPGIVFKNYPCCASTHAAIEATLWLRRSWSEHPPPSSIRVEIASGRLAHVDRPAPSTGLEAKFSVQYTVACAWVRGRCGIDDFSDKALSERVVNDLTRRVCLVGVRSPEFPWSAARVTASRGARPLSAYVAAAAGHSEATPLKPTDVAAKASALKIPADVFEALAKIILGGGLVRELIEFLEATVRGPLVPRYGEGPPQLRRWST